MRALISPKTCFCFDEQHLGPGETQEMPVIFYLDPALEKDPAMAAVQTITLSYIFFALKGRSGGVAGENTRTREDDWPP